MILALLVACHGNKDVDAPQWSAIEGTLDYDYVVDDFQVCDATISFTGAPYTGECEGCDFAFEIDPVLERNEGTLACPFNPYLSLYAPGALFTEPTVLGFEDHDNGVPDEVVIGASAVYTSGKTSTALYSFADGAYGAVNFDGTHLGWDLQDAADAPKSKKFGGERYSYFVSPCERNEPGETNPKVGPFTSTAPVEGTLPCAAGYVDAFEFQGIDGGTAYLSVDKTTDDASFALLLVYGPQSCLAAIAGKNFECSVGTGGCPAATIDTTPGNYLVALVGWGCDDDAKSTGYRLDLDTSWDAGLEQIEDDIWNYGKATVHVVGAATLSE